ncbi:hypothetical protein EC973_000370 [Apophysomyces ossiformis]|uniref:Cytochrome c oxidase assembly factor 3 n=1 Tax=Apophysomyces ossiformis TaxID=679940 RepID=A0A8H7BLR6_9FUNG|nr:hypothetical protein EC973_000370 [Apophysomyces ossiformis]
MTGPTREKLYSYPKGGFTPALQRTRKPFQVRNIATLAGLITFVAGVYSYALFAVKQDDFSDVPMPNTFPGVHDVTKEMKKNNE